MCESRRHHVVESDVTCCSVGPDFWTSVVFASNAEIDSLIHALNELKQLRKDANAHCHLQHYSLDSRNGSPITEAEIIFHGPGYRDTDEMQDRREMSDNAGAAFGTPCQYGDSPQETDLRPGGAKDSPKSGKMNQHIGSERSAG